jgi:3-methyladenine DNA glycosylase/8-oxoguanine DNA glycosylase
MYNILMADFRRLARFSFKPLKPYSFELTVKKPAGWSWFTPYEKWENGTIWSGFWFGKTPLGVKARSSGSSIIIDIYASIKLSTDDLARLKNMMGQALGVDEDIRPLYKMMRRSRILKGLVRHLYGMREGWGMNIFSSLSLAILLQMAPIKRSEEMWDCLIRSYGKKISFEGKTIILWPNESVIAKLEPRELAAKCRLGYRAKFLVKMARQLVRGFPSIEELSKMTPDDANDKLMELFGVGEYTAGFASPHPAFSLDVWSIKFFHPILFGRPVPAKDPRAAIKRTLIAAEKMWGQWKGYVFVYVLNDLDYLSKTFNLPIK